MEKIKNLSLRKTIILYVGVSLLLSFLLSSLLVTAAESVQQRVWWKYMDEDAYFEAQNEKKEAPDHYEVSVPRPEQARMSERDWHISEICDFMETYSSLLLAVAGSGAAVGLFYRNKLKTPLRRLQEASERIAGNQLDFQLSYQNQDEMGQLCAQFERMRAQLAENNRQMWRMVEEERALRAAVAHDIRSPLTVLKGYQEMMLEFLSEEASGEEEREKLSQARNRNKAERPGKDQLQEMLEEGMRQIERMDSFIENMRKMTGLERRELCCSPVEAESFRKQIEKEARMLGKDSDLACSVNMETGREKFDIDRELVLEVADNLLSNAFRYARTRVQVLLSSTDTELILEVRDDGGGFQEDTAVLTEAFYHSNPQDDLKHFGLGMYLCRIYCEKHGGRLLTGNTAAGGACVKAVFRFMLYSSVR